MVDLKESLAKEKRRIERMDILVQESVVQSIVVVVDWEIVIVVNVEIVLAVVQVVIIFVILVLLVVDNVIVVA